jgi:hypothetical protein
MDEFCHTAHSGAEAGVENGIELRSEYLPSLLSERQNISTMLCYFLPLMPALEYPHIQKDVGEPARLDRLPRVRVAQIVADHLGYGWSAEEIIRQYPHLTPAEVHAALAYYFDHREEIDGELAAELRELDRLAQEPPSALRLRLRALRQGNAA